MTSNEKVVPVKRVIVVDKIIPSAGAIKKLHAVPVRTFLEHGVVRKSAIALEVDGGLTCLTTIASRGAPFAIVVVDFIVDANLACFLHIIGVPPNNVFPWIGEAQLSMKLKNVRKPHILYSNYLIRETYALRCIFAGNSIPVDRTKVVVTIDTITGFVKVEHVDIVGLSHHCQEERRKDWLLLEVFHRLDFFTSCSLVVVSYEEESYYL